MTKIFDHALHRSGSKISETTKNQLDFNFETDIARKIFDFLDCRSIENARLAKDAWRRFLDSPYERRRCLKKLRKKFDQVKCQMELLVKGEYHVFHV